MLLSCLSILTKHSTTRPWCRSPSCFHKTGTYALMRGQRINCVNKLTVMLVIVFSYGSLPSCWYAYYLVMILVSCYSMFKIMVILDVDNSAGKQTYAHTHAPTRTHTHTPTLLAQLGDVNEVNVACACVGVCCLVSLSVTAMLHCPVLAYTN